MTELHAMRHSAAHVMAEAIKELYPNAQFAFGPETDDGFYYDVKIPGGSLQLDDLSKIEKSMQKIVKGKHPFEKRTVSRKEALEFFKDQEFKIKALEGLLKDETEVSLYTQNGFTDLCRGPHVENTGQIGAFKIDRIAGSYWLGDSQNEPLQRVYGLCFVTKEELKEYQTMLEEAKKRDHRVIGKKLDLFSFHDEGAGFVFWHPRGLRIFNALLEFIREEGAKRGGQEIRTPEIMNVELWHRSGHYDNFKENMYFTKAEERDYAVRPMNCPGSILVYKEKLHSFRDLPLRLMEMGHVHRFELSGVLHGLFRLRAFTQDDGHIYCAPEQIESEIANFVSAVFSIYKVFGFEEISVFIATKPESAMGNDEIWESSTNALKSALQKQNIDYKIKEGEGAFYGPKIEFNVKDCIKRNWQLGTIQVDFSMPERFDLEYVGSDSSKHRPVLLHRAILGSLERFLGIYIEQVAGNFPVWIAPLQAMVIPVTDAQNEYSQEIVKQLSSAGIRGEADLSSERMNKKIRNAQQMKTPYMIILGEKEAGAGNISVRLRTGENVNEISVSQFTETVNGIVRGRSDTLWPS
ncbi:MAG: threonine--tRNA ligase [Nitrospinota bacterium]|nr:threonine--tRNA ligase [Nitrospinota bacterium]